MAFVTFFDVEGARKNGWSESSIRDMLSRIEKINREQEQESEQESEPESESEDISLLPDNSPRVPLYVLRARREQLSDLYRTYGDDSIFDQLCNITGIINAREEEEENSYENF